MLSEQQRNRIVSAFRNCSLLIRSLSPGGKIEWKPIREVHRSKVSWEDMYEVTTQQGRMIVTAGHRVYTDEDKAIEAKDLQIGSPLLQLNEDKIGWRQGRVQSIRRIDSREFAYDLTVGENHTLILHNTQIAVHNCPDKFYHFRPPEFEGDIGQYNRIFGQIWEDAELHEYLERGLDWWNLHPPDTCHSLPSLDKLCMDRKCWREAVFWGAIHHACFALTLNWIADEFDYSIGGVSLSIEKSSKYQSMADAASAQFDKAAEAKARTVKFIRGLKQPRFGIGVRSAFGPYVGRGVLSPRSFM